MIKNSARCNRLVDSSPVPDVEGGDIIGFSFETAGNAFEERSFRSVPPIDRMAFGAFPARVMRIYHNNGNAHFLSFVFNERPELIERP